MKKMKRIALAGFLCMMTLPLAACAKKEKEATVDKNHVFAEKDLSELLKAVEITQVDDVSLYDGRLYLRGSYYGEDYAADNRLASVGLDGSNPIFFQLNEDDVYYYEDEEWMDDEDVALYDDELLIEADSEDSVSEDAKEEADTEDSIMEDAGEENTEDELVAEDIIEDDYYEDMEDYSYEYSYYSYFSVIEGNFVLIRNDYTESYENDEYNCSDEYFLVSYDINGNQLSEQKIELAAEDESAYVSSMVTTKKGEIYLLVNDSEIFHFNKELSVIDQFKIDGFDYVEAFYAAGNDILIVGWDQKAEKDLIYMLKDGNTKPDKFDPPEMISYGTSFYSGDGQYPAYVSTDKEIYGWDMEKNELVEILDFIDSDISLSYIEDVYAISDTDFIVCYESLENYETVVSEFTKVDPKDIPDREILTLACMYLDYDVKAHIIEFNKNNDKYRISVTEYDDYDSYDDYSAGLTKLNNDIAAGKIPDIFLLSSDMPISSYLDKGMLADFTKYIENDPDFTMDDFAPNIVKAYSKDNVWYALVPTYDIMTYGAKESLVGDKTNWTVEDALALWEQYPEASLLDETTNEAVLSEGMYCMGNHFIDWNTGTCNFNSDEFISLLEFANRFPTDFEYSDEYWDDYWQNYETMYRENKVLMKYMYISSIKEINSQEQGEMGEKITFVGFPTLNGTGSYISPNLEFGISSSCSSKEGAWEFIKYYLSDEYLANENNYVSLPITMSGLEKQVVDAQQRPYYYDENEEKVEYDDTYYFNGGEITISPMTAERANEILDFILSVENTSFYDDDITTLISEEAESYFSGQKSAKEVAEIIQSRAQIYVNEHMN